jgi:site-specific recombinase XerD
LTPVSGLPRVITAAGEKAQRRFLEFFTAHIRNPNTRRAYARACVDFFRWCDERPVDLGHIDPIVVAAYIEQHAGSKPTVKQHLAALKMLFDWMVVGQIIPANPAASVRPPRQVVRQGKTSVLSPEETRRILDSIGTTTVIGLRDRALIGLMVYTFARVSAAIAMKVEDVLRRNGRMWIRLKEKGGKILEIPAHHQLVTYLSAYIDAVEIRADKKGPLFRAAVGRTRMLASKAMSRADVYRMIRRRALDAGIETPVGCHTFRATGITAYLKNGGRLEVAQNMAGHETQRTTALYDRRHGEVTIEEVEKVGI